MIVLYFDTETTGIKSWKNPGFMPALVQLGAILQNTETGRILAEVNLINKDCGAIPAEASAIHGIDDATAMVYGVSGVGIDRLFANLISKADVIVAHNLDYDLDVITDNMPDSIKQLPGKKTFCTMDSNVYIVKAPLTKKQKDYFTSKGSKPDTPYKVPSLAETYQHYFGEMFEGAHDAMADIRATQRIFTHMIEKEIYIFSKLGDIVPSKKTAKTIKLGTVAPE